MSKKNEALRLALEYRPTMNKEVLHSWATEMKKAALEALAEQPAQQALDKMAENARELGLDYEPAQPKYRRGDRLICLETEEYCVIHISGTDRQWVKFPDTHIGVYKNEQLAELFELLPKEIEIEQPAQQEPCGGCGGSGWVPRDPDIGTDQECFVCEGKGTVEPEQPAQQEPVAYGMWDTMLGKGNRMMMVRLDRGQDGCTVPLYTSPPAQRTWVGLTDEEQTQVAWSCGAMSADWLEFARAIEAKLKEKNT